MPRIHFLSGLILTLLVAGAASAATFIVPPDREMVRRADAIALVTAGVSQSQPSPSGGIETITTMTTEDVLKGTLPAVFDVREPGGEYGGRAVVIPGVPRFDDGERLLLFLTKTPDGAWAVTEIVLGRFAFQRDRNGRQLLVRSEAEIVGWDPDGTPHREPHRDAVKFLDFIRAEARGLPARTDYEAPYAPLVQQERAIGTTSTPTRVAVTAFSANSYTSDVSGGRGSRWNVFPGAVNWYTPSGATSTMQSLTSAAVAAWTNDCPSNINYVYKGNDPCSPSCHTGGLSAPDGLNTVLFERNLASYGISPFSCSGSSYSGTLGIGGVTSTSGSHTAPNGETFWTTQEGDVEMNQGVLGCSVLVSSGNLNSGVTHEVGHTLGFRHSDQTRANNPSVPCSSDPSLECSSSAIMRATVPNGLNGALQQWDKNAAVAVYPGGSCVVVPPPPPPPNPGSSVSKDLNKDGQSDVFWWNNQTDELVVWYLTGGRYAAGQSLASMGSTAWHPVAEADFNGDGFLDIVWRNFATGANVIWLMNGATRVQQVNLPTSTPNWFIEASGDFNGDGRPDLVWHDHNSGIAAVWFMSGTVPSSSVQIQGAVLPWHIVGAADFNADGGTDLFWRNFTTGQNVIWRMSGTTPAAGVAFDTVADPNWRIVAVADYNNDGAPDLYWHNVANGQSEVWYVRNFAFSGAITADPLTDLRWEGAGPR